MTPVIIATKLPMF